MSKIKKLFQALVGVGVMLITSAIELGKKAFNRFSKCSKLLKVSIIILISAVVLLRLTSRIISFYDMRFGRYEWNDEHICGSIWKHQFHNGQIRLYDESIDKYTTPRINWISDISDDDSLVVYALPGKRGYLNVHTGQIVVEANEYQSAWIFSEGLAAVAKDGMIGFINHNNEVVIPFKFPFPKFTDDEDYPVYLFHGGYCVMNDINGKLGLIDKEGNWVLDAAYERISNPINGYREVYDGLYGILGPDFEVIKPNVYDYAELSGDSTIILAKNGKKWMEDFNGNVIIPFMYDYSSVIYNTVDSCYQGEYDLMSDYCRYIISGHVGIMNRITGEPITDAIYESVSMISDKLFEVEIANSYDCTILDLNGNLKDRNQ